MSARKLGLLLNLVADDDDVGAGLQGSLGLFNGIDAAALQ